jgi:hypothetical protein
MTEASDQLEAAQKMGDIGALSASIESMLHGVREMIGTRA